MTQPYVPPTFEASSFNCPFCNAYAHQQWADGGWYPHGNASVDGLSVCRCSHCNQFSLWWEGNMVHPDSSTAPMPNSDLPDDIRHDFEEARSIINRSPRGAAALLRLCVQKLCAHLGESGKNINQDIAALVKKGLDSRVQKSLDIVRVIGNEAVHPGELDLRDDPDTAAQLAKLVNIIANVMITQPKHIDTLYDSLPAEKKGQIDKRDGKM
jgi:hypothetical protein